MWLYTVYYISVNCSLYMFRVVTPPIIRSTYNCGAFGTAVPNAPQQRKVAEAVWPVPDAVITVIYAPDDGWSYHPKHVERAVYRNIINCI